VELDTTPFGKPLGSTYDDVTALLAQLLVPVNVPTNVVAVTVLVVNVFEWIAPLTPIPPLTINAPEEVLIVAVVFVMVIAFVVVDPKSVTSCKSCSDGPGSYVGSDCSTH
jgi:hypothetical protein